MLRIDEPMRLVNDRDKVLIVARGVSEFKPEIPYQLQIRSPGGGVCKKFFAVYPAKLTDLLCR